jgi:hypothetical protein
MLDGYPKEGDNLPYRKALFTLNLLKNFYTFPSIINPTFSVIETVLSSGANYRLQGYVR